MSHLQTLFMRGVSGEPLHIERAEGAYLYTRDGKKILDAAAGAVVVNIGQGREELAKLAAAEMARLSYIVPVWLSPARERLVERLSRWTPEGINRFYFTSGGSEAVEAAVKFAVFYNAMRKRPKKKLIVSRWISYHGNTIATLSVGGNRARRADYEQVLIDWPKIDPSYCYRCPWGKTYPGCELDCASALETALKTYGAENIAAFIAEPIVGASGGVIAPVKEYWPRIAETCRRNDILLIADEVMTGFGRTGRKFAAEHWNVNPDVIVGGKGLTGGYMPMGMIGVQDRLVEECEQAGGDFMFYTYSALPAVCAVADRVLEIMEREKLVERSATVGAKLGARLKETIGSHPMVGDIRGIGMFWAVEMVRDRATREPFPKRTHLTNKVIGAAMRRGLFVYPSTGMAGDQGGDAVMITPPFIIGEAEIEFIATTLQAALEDIRAVVM